MSFDRRQVLTGATAVASLSVASSLSACSMPSEYFDGKLPQSYFGLIASRNYEDADKLVAGGIKLSIVSFAAQDLFVGKKAVRGFISNLFLSSGFAMIGDNPEYAMGGFWGREGDWYRSDMIKGNSVELSNCVDQLSNPVFNVFVGIEEDSELIANILLLENHNLSTSLVPGVIENG